MRVSWRAISLASTSSSPNPLPLGTMGLGNLLSFLEAEFLEPAGDPATTFTADPLSSRIGGETLEGVLYTMRKLLTQPLPSVDWTLPRNPSHVLPRFWTSSGWVSIHCWKTFRIRSRSSFCVSLLAASYVTTKSRKWNLKKKKKRITIKLK